MCYGWQGVTKGGGGGRLRDIKQYSYVTSLVLVICLL